MTLLAERGATFWVVAHEREDLVPNVIFLNLPHSVLAAWRNHNVDSLSSRFVRIFEMGT